MRMKNRTIAEAVGFLFVCMTIGCIESNSPQGEPEEEYENARIERRVGFVTVPARKVTVLDLAETEISSAELFYQLIPAQEDAANKPVFVLFNGGPGAATSGFLQLDGTGPYTVDSSNWEMKESEHPLTELANLLYIDPRQTGFSFSRSLPGSAPGEPPKSQLDATFNNYTDAADIIFAMLDILDAQPPLYKADVVFVAESFGGARAQHMFDLLLRPTQLLSPSVYRDDMLRDRLREHFKKRLPATEFEALNPEIVREQFGRQILIQPGGLLPTSSGFCESCRCMLGELECPAGSSIYDVRKPSSWIESYVEQLPGFLLNDDVFKTVYGISSGDIELLTAAGRTGAYRLDSVEAPDAWVAAHGTLEDHDSYFVPFAMSFSGIFMQTNSIFRQTADLFIRNGVWVDTFITRAYYDAAVNVDGLPSGMLYTTGFLHPEPLIREAYLDTHPRDGVERPGWASLTYTEAAGIPEERRVEWRMPLYSDSGHSVTAYQSSDFYEDVAAFLRDTGANL